MSISAQAPSPTPENRPNWRKVQTLSPKQEEYINAMTCQGIYSKEYIEKWNQVHPENPRQFTFEPRVLMGGAGYGGKGHTIRACMVELHATYLHLGVTFPVTGIAADTYPNLADWQIRELTRKYQDWGEVKENHAFGMHFKFHDRAWGVCLLRNLDKPDKRGGNVLAWQVDESTLIPWDILEDMMYSCRGGDTPLHPIGFASNPDGPHSYKFKKLFVDHDFTDEPDGLKVQAKQFFFLPILVDDNPSATEADKLRLTNFSDPMMVKARRWGEWDILHGLRFPLFSKRYHTFTWKEFCDGYGMPMFSDASQFLTQENGFRLFGSLDYGTALESATAFYLHAVDWKKRVWTFEELVIPGRTLKQQAPEICELLKRYRVSRIYCDPSLAGKDDDGMARIDKFRNEFRAILGKGTVPIMEGSRDRIERWATIDDLLHYVRMEEEPRSLVQPPALRILIGGGGFKGCPLLINDIASAPRHVTTTGTKIEDVDPQGGIHHYLDSVSYFYHSFFKGGVKREAEFEPYTRGWYKQLHESQRPKQQVRTSW